MPHVKTDSESSLATTSPTRSPRRPVYYVQSPSRDSHDGEKTTTATSFHSTPVLTSPMGSPPHSVGRHSRESSSSRFSGSLIKPGGSLKISPNDVVAQNRKGRNPWDKEIGIIEEEVLLEDEESRDGLPRRCYILAFIIFFFILFSLFSLILWGASKPQKPTIAMKSITFERLVIQAGSDYSGVATDMVTLNSTVKLTFRNTATFFGVHVTSTPVDLSYSQITIGSGSIKKFYQKRKTQSLVTIPVMGSKIPFYGSGVGLSTSTGTTTVPVPLTLKFVVRSRAYVLGKLVKPKFNKKIECSVVFDPKKINVPISLKNVCTYG